MATDNVGHREATPAAAEATTTIVTALSVTNTADSGAGSLRQAILDANNSSGTPHTIQFQLPAGSQTITLLSPLPTAADPLTLSLDASQNVAVIPSAGAVWTDNQSLAISGPGSLAIGGGIDGTGDLAVNAGNNLTANHIVQSALVIGGTAESPAMVTIAASDASGNPLTSSTAAASNSAIAATTITLSSTSNNSAVIFTPERLATLIAKRLAQRVATTTAQVSAAGISGVAAVSAAPEAIAPSASVTAAIPQLAVARISPAKLRQLDAAFALEFSARDSVQWGNSGSANTVNGETGLDSEDLAIVDELLDSRLADFWNLG